MSKKTKLKGKLPIRKKYLESPKPKSHGGRRKKYQSGGGLRRGRRKGAIVRIRISIPSQPHRKRISIDELTKLLNAKVPVHIEQETLIQSTQVKKHTRSASKSKARPVSDRQDYVIEKDRLVVVKHVEEVKNGKVLLLPQTVRSYKIKDLFKMNTLPIGEDVILLASGPQWKKIVLKDLKLETQKIIGAHISEVLRTGQRMGSALNKVTYVIDPHKRPFDPEHFNQEFKHLAPGMKGKILSTRGYENGDWEDKHDNPGRWEKASRRQYEGLQQIGKMPRTIPFEEYGKEMREYVVARVNQRTQNKVLMSGRGFELFKLEKEFYKLYYEKYVGKQKNSISIANPNYSHTTEVEYGRSTRGLKNLSFKERMQVYGDGVNKLGYIVQDNYPRGHLFREKFGGLQQGKGRLGVDALRLQTSLLPLYHIRFLMLYLKGHYQRSRELDALVMMVMKGKARIGGQSFEERLEALGIVKGVQTKVKKPSGEGQDTYDETFDIDTL